MEVLHINVGCGNTCRVLRPNKHICRAVQTLVCDLYCSSFFFRRYTLKFYIDIIFAIFESKDTYSFSPIIVGIHYLFVKFQDYFLTKKLSESDHPKSRRLENHGVFSQQKCKEARSIKLFFCGSSIHQYIHGLVQKFPRILLSLDPVFFSLDP